jgi:hypothetical protein
VRIFREEMVVKGVEEADIAYWVSTSLFGSNHNEVKLGVKPKCSVILHTHLST